MLPTPSAQRLQRGLPGYLILFAPHAFAPQRQYRPRDPPSPPVFLLISAHFTVTTRSPSSPTRRRCIRLPPIVQYSPLLPPVGVWAVSQSQCGRSPSQAGYPSSPW